MIFERFQVPAETDADTIAELTFIGTDPLHERRGAASLLVAWGIEQCRLRKAPAYLESTLEAARFYERRGFTAGETFSLDTPGVGSGTYAETVFVFTPTIGSGCSTEGARQELKQR